MARNREATFEVFGLPPSVNHALVHARGRTFPTKEYKEWRKLCKALPIKKIKKSKWYGVEIFFFFPIFYKNGNVRKKDRSNFIKYAEDELCRRLETYSGEKVDDSLIKVGTAAKIDSAEITTIFTIYCL